MWLPIGRCVENRWVLVKEEFIYVRYTDVIFLDDDELPIKERKYARRINLFKNISSSICCQIRYVPIGSKLMHLKYCCGV